MYIDDFVGWSSQGSLQGSGQLHVQGTEDLPNPTPELDRVRCQMVLIPTPNRDNSHPAGRRCVKKGHQSRNELSEGLMLSSAQYFICMCIKVVVTKR